MMLRAPVRETTKQVVDCTEKLCGAMVVAPRENRS